MTSTGAVAGVAFLAYLEHPLAPRPRPGQIVVLDRLGGAPQTGGAGGDRSAGVRVGAVAWVRPGLQPQRVGFQQDRGVRESCGGEDEGERWTLRSRLRWGRCRWGMWWVGLSMPESRITHCENRCKPAFRNTLYPFDLFVPHPSNDTRPPHAHQGGPQRTPRTRKETPPQHHRQPHPDAEAAQERRSERRTRSRRTHRLQLAAHPEMAHHLLGGPPSSTHRAQAARWQVN